MQVTFVVYSSLIYDYVAADVYALALADEALIRVDEYNNALIVSRIGEELLARLVVESIADLAPEDYAEQLQPLDGGLRIAAGDVVIDSQCCGDIGNYENWQRLLTQAPTKWQELWIGHPWIYARFDDDFAYFSEYYDYEQAPTDIRPRLVLPREEFVAGLREALAGLYAFFYLLRRVVLADGAGENKAALLDRLTDGYFPHDEDDAEPLGHGAPGPLAPRRIAGSVES